jgi:hypothetical protein
MLAALAIGVLGATALGNTVIAATPPLQHSTATVIPLPQPRLVRDELMNPELPAQERALLQKPTEVVTGSYETLGPNGDPIAHAYVEWIELGIPMWEWNVWQGFSDNGTDITSFPPPTYSVDIWYPGWVLDNEGYSYTGRTGVTQGTSDNSAVFQFYAFGIPSLTVDAYIDFTLYGNGHWINSAGANPSSSSAAKGTGWLPERRSAQALLHSLGYHSGGRDCPVTTANGGQPWPYRSGHAKWGWSSWWRIS